MNETNPKPPSDLSDLPEKLPLGSDEDRVENRAPSLREQLTVTGKDEILTRLQRVEEENQKLRDALWKAKPYIILYLRDRANPETVGEAQAQERIEEIETLLADLEQTNK